MFVFSDFSLKSDFLSFLTKLFLRLLLKLCFLSDLEFILIRYRKSWNSFLGSFIGVILFLYANISYSTRAQWDLNIWIFFNKLAIQF